MRAVFNPEAVKLAALPMMTIEPSYQGAPTPTAMLERAMARMDYAPTPHKPTNDELREADENEYVPGAT